MRVALTIIAFLFLAVSAQSQVLKSAGVWYFLDVDSMTARPAVLPNGTELAYVVGTKTVYYWNRNTNTWTAYGSTFGRDSIYFDASITGSGTVSDPWGVDSTLFATITAVGDSIAAALADYFPLQGGTLTGTGGNGFVGYPTQSGAPSTPGSGFKLFADATGRFSWMQSDGFIRTLISPTPIADRAYRFQNKSYTLADSADVAALPTGSGTTNYYAKWSSGTALGIGNLFDNNTYVGILNSKPFSLGQWTTAGRPTGVNGYVGFNTSTNWLDVYSSTGWFSPARAATTGGAFTAGYIPFGGTGGLAESSAFTFTSGTATLNINGTAGNSMTIWNPNTAADGVLFVTNRAALVSRRNTSEADYAAFAVSAPSGDLSARLSVGLYTGAPCIGFGSGPALRDVFVQRPIASQALTFNFTTSNTERFRFTNTAAGFFTNNPQRHFHVEGEVRISDLTTDTPTQIVGADADGDLGAITVSTGLSLSSGSLTAQNIYTANGTLTSNRTLSGGGFDLRLDTDVTVSDSLKVVGLANHTDPDSIVTAKNGWLGKRKWMMPSANAYDGTSSGYFFDSGKLGHQIDGNNKYSVLYTDTTGYYEITGYSTSGSDYSSIYGRLNGITSFARLENTYGTIYNGLRIQLNEGFAFNHSANTMFRVDTVGTMRVHNYGTLTKSASALSKTFSTLAGFATDGTVLNVEQKRDTTIYVTDADYNFASALTSAQILARYNNIIIYSKLTASATSDNQIILHSASSDFLQCTISIYSNDASADADATSIDFTTNGAVDGAGGTVSTYGMVGGEKITIRAVNDSGYKWIFN